MWKAVIFRGMKKRCKQSLRLLSFMNYMASVVPADFHKALPRSVYLYFMHGNSLDYHKCAFLYSNLITYEDESSEIYAHYRDEMEAFAWNQLDRRNVDEQLRIIYKRFVVEASMNPERVKALYDVCHAYRITTKVPNMKFIHVIADDGTITQKSPERVYSCMRKPIGLCGSQKTEGIIQILSHMRVRDFFMSFAIWICAGNILTA